VSTSNDVARLVCLFLLLGASGTVLAQKPKDNIVIHARAGRVNHAAGNSQVRRIVSGSTRLLVTGDDLAVDDLVDTGSNAQLEVLLNPGSFLRVTDNTQFQITSNSPQRIRIALIRGSAVIENGPDHVFSIQVITPLGMAFFENRGIYRVNAQPEGAEFRSIDGDFTLGSRKVNLATGQHVTVTGSGVGPVTNFDAKTGRDYLESWSRNRAEVLAKANRKLDTASLALAIKSALADDGLNAALQGQFGFWANSSLHGFTVFVPVYPSWKSPYGFEYTNGNDTRDLADNNAAILAPKRWPGRQSAGAPASQEVKPRGVRVPN
jgi:hypothetical protein